MLRTILLIITLFWVNTIVAQNSNISDFTLNTKLAETLKKGKFRLDVKHDFTWSEGKKNENPGYPRNIYSNTKNQTILHNLPTENNLYSLRRNSVGLNIGIGITDK